MTDAHPGPVPHRLTPDEALARILEWQAGGGGTAGRVNLAAEQDGPTAERVLREVHRQVAGSVFLDATGRTAEELLRGLLEWAEVPEDARTPWDWEGALADTDQETLVLIAQARAAGSTRRSAQPQLLGERLAEHLSLTGNTKVVITVSPEARERRGTLTLPLGTSGDENRGTDSGTGTVPDATTDVPLPVRALALSEPRLVPLPVWRELMKATAAAETEAGTPGPLPESETELSNLADQFPELLRCEDGMVSFREESTARAVRSALPPQVFSSVGRHMVNWLVRNAADFRHPEGWAASGVVGRYAADGLAMHAVQADAFEELAADGQVVAHIPQRSLIDAAHCAYAGSLPGNNAAADAVHLWTYGIAPGSQPEWAAWLHLMAIAREDTALAAGIEGSGVRLPWTAAWSHWRPPGGYHQRYLSPGSVDDLYAVSWAGRPAVLSKGSRGYGSCVWDLATGERLAGPWDGDGDFPTTWQARLGRPSPDGDDAPEPVSFRDLDDASQTWEGALEELLYISLAVSSTVVAAGAGGLFAVRLHEDGAADTGIPHPDATPLLGATTAAGPAQPQGAPEPSPEDLFALCGPEARVRTPDADLPAGLTDHAARQALTRTGLPTMDSWGLRLEPEGAGFLAETTWPSAIPAPAERGPFYRLGMWVGGEILLDGPSGHVLRRPGDIADPVAEGGVLVATSLENLLTMAAAWITGRRILATVDNNDEAHLLRQHIEDALWVIDPDGAGAGAWTYPLHND